MKYQYLQSISNYIKICQKQFYHSLNSLTMTQLLQIYNRHSFNYATSNLLSYLTKQDLLQFLQSIEERSQYGKLAHKIRSHLIVVFLYQVDRSLYYIHFEEDGIKEMRRERCNLIALSIEENMLKNILFCWKNLEKEIQENFHDQSEVVKSYIFQPDLALPPLKRASVAPLCQTTYQIYLTVNRLEQLKKQQNHQIQHNQDMNIDKIAQILEFQAKLMEVEIRAIQCPYQLFTELCYRFQIYRNSLLAFHSLRALKKMSNYMKIWWAVMQPYYNITNKIYVSLLVKCKERGECQRGWATDDIIIEEGYIRDYAQSLIDLSISEENAAFCGHSKQKLEGPYKMLENQLFNKLQSSSDLFFAEDSKNFISKCYDFGLKSHTICKVAQIMCSDTSTNLCRNDSFIEKCAQINGLNHRRVQCAYG